MPLADDDKGVADLDFLLAAEPAPGISPSMGSLSTPSLGFFPASRSTTVSENLNHCPLLASCMCAR